jgi:hypothetical protein
MKWLRRPALWLVVVVVGGVTCWSLGREQPPMDDALWSSVRPVIHEQLPLAPEVATTGILAATGHDRARWFCAEKPIEIRREDDAIRVGMIAHCEEYGQRDGALLTGSGTRGAMVVTVTGEPGAYRLAAVRWASDGASHESSIREMFTPAGAREALAAEGGGGSPDSAGVADTARRHFGWQPEVPGLPG